MSKYNFKKIGKNVFWIMCFVVFIYFLSSIDKQVLEDIAIRLGWLGPVFIGLVFVITHVFAPISGTAFYFVGIRLYGYESILIIYYCASMVSATIAFFIARKWGRGLVIKLVGEKTMNHIDKSVAVNENYLLVVGRLFGYSFFDFISYTLGFTKVSFKKYITYTAIFTFINSLILYFIFRNLDFESFQNSIIYHAFIVLTGLLLAYLFSRVIRNKTQ